ncbi:hypothetical protein KFL_000260500 [Klebsormidium nitens]|uniref:Uncharacterized protein n=1 Tax=Klebsormidium nitens TaxID=105231 RepID=A0A1Y1HMJ4_KLENI|nr:hypothetical protein KFL_000260500 [Klebsormidium nitens]|eukprot:GAQ79233.1 hypothetical protein KFL_000260500 [Klebsormidium nitens]
MGIQQRTFQKLPAVTGNPGSTPSQPPHGGASGPTPEQGGVSTNSPGGGGSTPSPGGSSSPGGTGSPGSGSPPAGNGGGSGTPPEGNGEASGSPPGGNGGANGSPPEENGGTNGSPPGGNGGVNGSPQGGNGGVNGSPPEGNLGGSGSPPGGNGGAIGSPPGGIGGAIGSPPGGHWTPPSETGGSGSPPSSGNGGGSPPDGSGGTGSPGSGSGSNSPPESPPTDAPGAGGSPTEWPAPPADGPAGGPSVGSPPDSAGQPTASPGSGTGAPGEAAGAEGPAEAPSESPSESPSGAPGGPICVGACNPGGGAEIIVTGQAFDSYLQSCTTFVDVNGNGIQDADEPSGMTDLFGQFNLSTPVYAPLVLLAGGECTDAATGVLLPGILSAPPGATVITPLTTLITQLGTRQNIEAVAAERILAEGLGLNVSAALTLTSTDVIAAVLATQDGAAARVVVQNTRAQNVAAMAAALMSAGGDRAAGAAATFGSLADAIWTLPTPDSGTAQGSGTSEGDETDAQLATEANNDTTGGSSPGAGQASLQLRRLLGMLSEGSPGGSIGNLDSRRSMTGVDVTVEDGCKEGGLERRPHCSRRVEAGTSGMNAELEEMTASRQGSGLEGDSSNGRQNLKGRKGRKLRRLLQDEADASDKTADSPADLTDPVFLESALEGAYKLLSNTSVRGLQPMTSTNDSTFGAPALSADDFALAASAMGVANAAMDAPLEAFLQLNLAGNTNRSAAIEFLNEIWRRAKVAQSNFADVLVQLGAGEINRTAAAAALSPAAFESLVANTTLLVSSGGGQASLQAQTGAPPPPGVIELPGSVVGGKHRAKSWVWIVIGVAVGVGGLLLCCCCGGVAYYCYRRKKNRRTGHRGADPEQGPPISPRRWPWSPRPVASSDHSTPPTEESPDVASPVESPPVSPGAILRSHSIALPPSTHLLPVAAQAETAREAPPGVDETPQETAFSTPRSGISSDSD